MVSLAIYSTTAAAFSNATTGRAGGARPAARGGTLT